LVAPDRFLFKMFAAFGLGGSGGLVFLARAARFMPVSRLPSAPSTWPACAP